MTVENGCLQIIPGSHLNGTLESESSGDGDAHRKIKWEPEDFVNFLMEPGDLVAFSRLTVHGSGPICPQPTGWLTPSSIIGTTSIISMEKPEIAEILPPLHRYSWVLANYPANRQARRALRPFRGSGWYSGVKRLGEIDSASDRHV
jgi:hypothetical protein